MPIDPLVEPEGAPTITIPMRHAVRTVIDGASITVVPDGEPDPAPSPLPIGEPSGAPGDADPISDNPTPSDKE